MAAAPPPPLPPPRALLGLPPRPRSARGSRTRPAPLLDAAGWLLVDAGVSGAGAAAAALQAQLLAELAAVLVATALLAPVGAALVFGAALSPALKLADGVFRELARAVAALDAEAFEEPGVAEAVAEAVAR